MRRQGFEVLVETGGKAEIDGIFGDETQAVARAQYLLSLAKFTAVRVQQVDARDRTRVIFEKAYQGGGRVIKVASINDAPLCRSVGDVYGYPSRRALLRLMRAWCDENVTIPTEVLHQPLRLRQIEREEVLFNQVVHRLAAAQVRRTHGKPEDQVDWLRKLHGELFALAKEAESLAPFGAMLRDRGVTHLITLVTTTLPEDERARTLTYAFQDFLSTAPDWRDKLVAIMGLFDGTPGPLAITPLDELIAEILDGATPVRAVLGYAPDLGSALYALACLVRGRLTDEHLSSPPLMELNSLNNRFDLPLTRAVLIDLIARSLDGTTRLTRLDRTGDAAALNRMIPLLKEYGGFLGGAAMCAAVTRRVKSTLSCGPDDLSYQDAVERVLEMLATPADKIGYLLDLVNTEFGRRRASHLLERLNHLFAASRSIREFVPRDAADDVESVTENFRRRLNGGGIPRDLAERFMQRIERMAAADRPAIARPPPPRPEQLARAADETIDISISGPEPAGPMPPYVVFSYQGQESVFAGGREVFVMGRGADCDLIVGFEGTSRAHAVVRQSGDGFVLEDQSRNGTYVAIENAAPVLAKRTSLPLTGAGIVFLGANPKRAGDDQHLIHFRCVVC